ncbi:hypothetical protein SAMN02745176_00132 [Lutispora thermophila DSM 19022]|uniref:Uncharacterized protein n=1 Tax=Lutispora thermophila DSM 19022 TaxID=1122184 RepID=A0A1M6AVW5_9FIRM|nr:hypothetical protein SAMN02745176_00132 [Lutispora thermophila DSM 19022]
MNTLQKDEVESLYKSTTNISDKLLIKLLFEARLRIDMALSLFAEISFVIIIMDIKSN